MSPPAEVAASGAGEVWRIIHGLSTYWITVAALDIGLFDVLALAPLTGAELAERLAVDRQRCAILVDGLLVAGLLVRDGEQLVLTDTAANFLVRDRGTYLGDLVRWSPGRWENLAALGATVRGDAPPRVSDPTFQVHLVKATFPAQYRAAVDLAQRLSPASEPLRILDLGAGSAPWSIAFLEAFPTATAVINDLAPVLALADSELDSRGLRERAELLEGDYWNIDLPDVSLAVLGHVCRAEGEDGAARLIALATSALVDGGRLIVADYFVDDDRRESVTPRMIGVTMLANTPSGGTYTYRQFGEWLTDAGLHDIELLRVGAFTEVLVATKRSSA